MRSVRAVAWIWSGAGILLVGMAVYLAIEQARGEGFTGDIAQFAFLFCLFAFVGGLLIAASRSLRRYGKFGWSSIVLLSIQGASLCLAFFTLISPLLLLGAALCLFSLWVLLAKEVRTRVWRREISGTGKQERHHLGGVPVRFAIIGLSAFLAEFLLRGDVSKFLPPGGMHWIFAGMLLIAAFAPLPFLYWKRNRASEPLAVLGGICLFAYFLAKTKIIGEAASWGAIFDLELFVFTAGAVMALAVFHMAIHLFDQERADATGFGYTMLVLAPAMICSVFAAAGYARLAVVVLDDLRSALSLRSLRSPLGPCIRKRTPGSSHRPRGGGRCVPGLGAVPDRPPRVGGPGRAGGRADMGNPQADRRRGNPLGRRHRVLADRDLVAVRAAVARQPGVPLRHPVLHRLHVDLHRPPVRPHAGRQRQEDPGAGRGAAPATLPAARRRARRAACRSRLAHGDRHRGGRRLLRLLPGRRRHADGLLGRRHGPRHEFGRRRQGQQRRSANRCSGAARNGPRADRRTTISRW